MTVNHENILELIRDFADKAHGDQMRKYSADRYIVHPWRVMTICKEYSGKISVCAAAILHDVLEDTDTTEEQITAFLQSMLSQDEVEETLRLVVELTDVYVKKNFPEMSRRNRKEKEALRLSKVSSDAQTIKYADIIDNAGDIAFDETNFAIVYLRECKQILSIMRKGNATLYRRAVQVVDQLLDKLLIKETSVQSIH